MTEFERDDARDEGPLDERMVRLARESYRVPPRPAPREAMWQAIAAALPSAADGGRPAADGTLPALGVVRGGAPEVVTTTARRSWWQGSAARFGGMAAAAALLLAIGFSAGRDVGRGDVAGNAGDSLLAVNPPAEFEGAEPVAGDADTGAGTDAPSAVRRGAAPSAATTRPAPTTDAGYQLATVRFLTEAEAMLTSYRGATGDAKADAAMAAWARSLLTNTRLLLDSPAADEPMRRRLLEDLELVLVQMVQLSPETAARERALIEESLRNGQMMTRLRSAVPAGIAAGA